MKRFAIGSMTKFIKYACNEKILLIFLFLFGILSWSLYCRNFIWDDSYFYLVIARNIILTGQQTFSNIFITNGIHPLWLYVLTAYHVVIAYFNVNLLFNESSALFLSAGVLAWGAINFWKVADLLKLPKFPFVGIPLGYLLFFQVLYSEAHIYFATLSYLTLISVKKSRERSYAPYLTGFICALVFLSRLDSIFFIFCYFIWYIINTDKRSLIIRFCSVFLAIVTPYFICNLIFFGGLVPISGWMKSSFPTIFLNKPLTGNCILGYNTIAGIIPIILSTTILIFIRKPLERGEQIVYVYLWGSILHCLYTIFYTRFHTLYWWYYVSHIILLSFAVALLLKFRPVMNRAKTALNFCMVALFCCLLAYFRWNNPPDSGNSIAMLLNFMKQHDIKNKNILVSDIPGIISFYSLNNIIAADMITANRKFFDAMRSAPNALTYLLDYCKDIGKPIHYYLHMGTGFIALNQKPKNATAITYNDPKLYPVIKSIGTLNFGHKLDYAFGYTICILWKLTDSENIPKSTD